MKRMPFRLPQVLVPLLCLSAVVSTSCLAKRRVITRQGGSVKQALKVADKDALIAKIGQVYDSIRDFSATVDMVPAIGTAEKSRITEYKDIRGYVLFRKPSDIRLIGLYPVVRNKAFDMVSNGEAFRLYVPVHNRFIVGKNQAASPPSKNKLENLRPQHFQDALLVRPVTPDETPVLENLTDEENAVYILHLLRNNGQLRLGRSVWFDRATLAPVRQIIFDPAGNILTDARYSQWQTYDNVPFPKQISINRPQDEYAVVVTVVKMEINKGLTNDKFALEQPPGSVLQVLGEKPAMASAPPETDGKKAKQ